MVLDKLLHLSECISSPEKGGQEEHLCPGVPEEIRREEVDECALPSVPDLLSPLLGAPLGTPV